MDLSDVTIKIVAGILFGVIYGLYGYITKHPPGEAFDPRKLIRTSLLWGAAGALVASSEGLSGLDEATIQQEISSVAVLGVLFDHGWSKIGRVRGGGSE